MDSLKPPPALDAEKRHWLRTSLATTLEAGCSDTYPSQLQHWIKQYLAFYQLPNCASPDKGLQHRMFRLDCQDLGIVVQVWKPAKCRGTLYYIHGYLDHTGLSRHIIQFALEHGFALVTFDLPGHGLSEGREAWIGSFEVYTDVLQAVIGATKNGVPEPFYLAGQSTGGAIVANYLIRKISRGENIGFSAVALLAPLVRPTHWGYLGHLFSVLRFFISATPRDFSRCSHDQNFLNFQKKSDPLQARWIPWGWLLAMVGWINKVKQQSGLPADLLIVQGDADKTVDFKYNLKVLQRAFVNPRVAMIAEARHHMINESEVYRTGIFAALKKHFGWQED